MALFAVPLRRAVVAATLLVAGSTLTGCGADADPQTSSAPRTSSTATTTTAGSKAQFCDEVIRHRDEYWTVATSFTSVQGVKDLLSGKTDVSGLGPMWRDLAEAAPGRIRDEVTLVGTKWETAARAYRERDWITLTRTVGSMSGPMADVNRFVRVACGKKYGPIG